jgi:hypothetical protein
MSALGSATTRPTNGARAKGAMPAIGSLRSTPPADSALLVAAFRRGPKETGYFERQNVAIEYRGST